MVNRGYQLSVLSIGLLVFTGTHFASAQERMSLSENDEWVATETIELSTPEGQLALGRKALAEEKYDRAENLASQWIKRNEDHPLAAEAYLLRADAYRGRRNYYDSLFDYEYIARVYPGSEVFVKALERELEIAKLFAGGLKRKLWGMRIVDASEEAQELLIQIQERLPGSRLAEDAGLALADFYFSRRQMSLAVDAYELFIENYPRSEHLSKARRRLIFAHLASFKGPEFDASGLYEARSNLKTFQVVEPAAAEQIGADALMVRIDESDARKLLVTAKWYLRTGNVVSAEIMIRRLVRLYPRSVATADALRLIPKILPQLSPQHLKGSPDYQTMRAALLQDAGTNRAAEGEDDGGSKAPSEEDR